MSDAKHEALSMLPRLQRAPDDSLPPGTSLLHIQAAAARLGLPFPPELVDWLQVCNGPVVGQGGIFGLRPDRTVVDIDSRQALLPEWCRREYLPVAGDGCGSRYVISSKPKGLGLFPVYFVDHQDYGVLDHPSYVVASGLWRFLCFYFRDDLGDQGWPCKESYVLRHDPALARLEHAEFCWGG
jgi:hypothetical protein